MCESQTEIGTTEQLRLTDGYEIIESDEESILVGGPRDGEYLSLRQSGDKFTAYHRPSEYDPTRIYHERFVEIVETWNEGIEQLNKWMQ